MSDSKKAVKEYMAKQGYPLEMYVAKEFRKIGFEVYQSAIYVDKETGKDREVDVAAYFMRRMGDVIFNFKIIIECKYVKNLWILFSGENEGFKDLQIDNFYGGNYAGMQMLNRLSISDGFKDTTWFKIKEKFGYGLTETIKEEKEKEGRTTYKAISTLINSLHYEKEIEDFQGKVFTLFIPVIVIGGGKLFECFLNEENEEEINEIDEGQLIYKANIYPSVFPVIEIITKDKVPALAQKLKNDFERIINNYLEELQPLFDNYPHNPEVLRKIKERYSPGW